MKQTSLKTEKLPLDSLIPYENNPKRHPEHQVKKIARAIENFGFHPPIEIDKDNVIIAGHGRYMAAKMLGMTEVPCVRRTDLDAKEARARRISDNKVSESPWDEALLGQELDLFSSGEGMTVDEISLLTAFDKDEVDELLKMVGEPSDLNLGDEGGEAPSGVKTYKKDPNVLIRISVHPGLWLGKREEIRGILQDIEKAYNAKISIEE